MDNHLQVKYEKLIDQETKLLQKIRTTDGYIKTCLSPHTPIYFNINRYKRIKD